MHHYPAVTHLIDGRLHTNLILRDKGIRLTWIPKNMCTTLKLSFGLAAGVVNPQQKEAFLRNPAAIHNWMFPLEPHNAEDLSWPTSVAVIRNPSRRLQSAIIEKGLNPRDDEFERVFGARLRQFANYIGRPLEHQTFADLLHALRFFPDRLWDPHVRSQVTFLNGDYTDLLRMEDNAAAFFERRGVEIVTADMHSITRRDGELRTVGPQDRLVAVRAEMAQAQRPIRFAPELADILEATIRFRFAADLELWNSLA